MNTLILDIVKLVLAAVCAVVILWFIPFMKRVTGNEKMNAILTWADQAVRYAEQVMGAGTGAEKKGVAMDFLKKIRDEQHLNITDEQLEIIIEAAVQSMTELKIQGIYTIEGDTDD